MYAVYRRPLLSSLLVVTLLTGLLLTGLLLSACGGGAPVDEATATDQRVVTFPVADDPTVSFSLSFRVGSENDPPGKEGLAELVGSLIASGATEQRSYEQILAALYPLASAYRVRVDKETTTLTGRTHRDNLEAFVPLLTDAYLHPAFSEADFERLRFDQRNAIAKTLRFASDEELGKAALASAVFAGTRYAHPVLGTLDGIDAITPEDVRQFYRTYFTRDNVVLGLGGGYQPALLERMRATLDQLPAGTPPPAPVIEPPPIQGRHVLLIQKPDAYASISFGFPIKVPRGRRDFYALWVVNSWLGEHRNSASHLYQVIRGARGLNYGDYSYIEAFPEGGSRQMPPVNAARHHQMFEIWIRTLPNEQAPFAIRAALHELQELVDHGMSEEAFTLTRSFLTKYHLHFAETTQARLGYAIDDRFYGIAQEGHLARFGRMMRELTLEDVNHAIQRNLQLDNIRFAIVTGEAETLAKTMIENLPAPLVYKTLPAKEIQTEDRAIEAVDFAVPAQNVRIVPVEEIFQTATPDPG